MDVTATIDPLYHPLAPSVDDVLTYAEEIEYEGNHITFAWADFEAKQHLLSFVRVGLVTYRIKLYKLYRGAFKSFQDYCQRALGKTSWYINRFSDAPE